jgi:prophage regulatory protein
MNNMENQSPLSPIMGGGKMTRIVRLPEVKNLTGLSTSTLYDRMKGGSFPRAIPLGGRLVGWLESDVRSWIEKRVAEIRQ